MKSLVYGIKTNLIINGILLLIFISTTVLMAQICSTSTSITTVAAGQTRCQNATPSTMIATAVIGGSGSHINLVYQWYYNTTNSNAVAGTISVQVSSGLTTSTTSNTLLAANISTAIVGNQMVFLCNN